MDAFEFVLQLERLERLERLDRARTETRPCAGAEQQDPEVGVAEGRGMRVERSEPRRRSTDDRSLGGQQESSPKASRARQMQPSASRVA
jgi:hypothetical protein